MENGGKLEGRVQVIETKLDSLAGKVEQLATSVDERFDAVDRRFDALEAAIVEQRQYTEFAFTQLDHKMDAGFARWDERLSRFERKVDQFIDVQVRTNDLVERRLRALESRKS
jgi:hypothetical protein